MGFGIVQKGSLGYFCAKIFLNVTKALYVASSGEIIISSMVIKPTYNNKKARAS